MASYDNALGMWKSKNGQYYGTQSEALDAEQQVWLLDWWQLALWRRLGRAEPLHRLERLRSQLRAYVQPRLAWEVALLEISAYTDRSGGGVAGG